MQILKPRWLFKARIDRLTVWVGRLGRRAIVARTRSPIFCFEGRNEADVRRKAERAIAFFRRMHSR